MKSHVCDRQHAISKIHFPLLLMKAQEHLTGVKTICGHGIQAGLCAKGRSSLVGTLQIEFQLLFFLFFLYSDASFASAAAFSLAWHKVENPCSQWAWLRNPTGNQKERVDLLAKIAGMNLESVSWKQVSLASAALSLRSFLRRLTRPSAGSFWFQSFFKIVITMGFYYRLQLPMHLRCLWQVLIPKSINKHNFPRKTSKPLARWGNTMKSDLHNESYVWQFHSILFGWSLLEWIHLHLERTEAISFGTQWYAQLILVGGQRGNKRILLQELRFRHYNPCTEPPWQQILTKSWL